MFYSSLHPLPARDPLYLTGRRLFWESRGQPSALIRADSPCQAPAAAFWGRGSRESSVLGTGGDPEDRAYGSADDPGAVTRVTASFQNERGKQASLVLTAVGFYVTAKSNRNCAHRQTPACPIQGPRGHNLSPRGANSMPLLLGPILPLGCGPLLSCTTAPRSTIPPSWPLSGVSMSPPFS